MALDIAASVVNNRRMSSSVSRHNTLAARTPGMEFMCGCCGQLFYVCTCDLGQLKKFICRDRVRAANPNASHADESAGCRKNGKRESAKIEYTKPFAIAWEPAKTKARGTATRKDKKIAKDL